MKDKDSVFGNQPFLPKQAAPASTGTFVNAAKDLVVKRDKLKLFNEAEQAARMTDKFRKSGTGSLAADGLLWLGKKIKGARAPIENVVGKTVGAFDTVDRKIGGWAAGTNPASKRGRIFSKKVQNPVGQAQNADLTFSDILKEDRKTSIAAPFEKTVKFTTPFLATAYVADKLYPNDENLGENVNQATYENQIDKSSSVFDESVYNQMDKIASFQKIAALENLVEKYANDLSDALMDKKAAMERLEQVVMEKESSDRRAAVAEQNFLQKQAEHEELRLRTIAQKRSKVAVDLSEEMLEHKLIKQAQYQETVDKLMECDESTLRMYESLVKEARTGADCLETLSYFGEYKNNDKLAAASTDFAKNGLSRKGQSIGDAARDLIK